MIVGVHETSFWECFPDMFWEPNYEANNSHGGEVIAPRAPRSLALFNIDINIYREREINIYDTYIYIYIYMYTFLFCLCVSYLFAETVPNAGAEGPPPAYTLPTTTGSLSRKMHKHA